ncbi:MAG: hypothetical protein KIS63_13535, partial [Caldilineales bacterium]|nr:hypothetical protein [Caldilineales bacterium]
MKPTTRLLLALLILLAPLLVAPAGAFARGREAISLRGGQQLQRPAVIFAPPTVRPSVTPSLTPEDTPEPPPTDTPEPPPTDTPQAPAPTNTAPPPASPTSAPTSPPAAPAPAAAAPARPAPPAAPRPAAAAAADADPGPGDVAEGVDHAPRELLLAEVAVALVDHVGHHPRRADLDRGVDGLHLRALAQARGDLLGHLVGLVQGGPRRQLDAEAGARLVAGGEGLHRHPA